MKILNLYAGIGGNRKLWGNDHNITAVEINPQIAKIYQDFFPMDRVIITDAHEFLLEHYDEFDFIWSSPPCPTHSELVRFRNNMTERKSVYPDMQLYQEIILLKHFAKCKYVIENVKAYYEPLIKPYISGSHYFWSNFTITNREKEKIRGILSDDIKEKEKKRFDLSTITASNQFKEKILNNCVLPELGLHILQCATQDKTLNKFMGVRAIK